MTARAPNRSGAHAFLDWILALPWSEYKDEKKDIVDAERVLDEDHFGLEKIKTIGDAYMAAAGLESGTQVHYADAVAQMALEMLERVRTGATAASANSSRSSTMLCECSNR